MSTPEPLATWTSWRKSSYSGGGTGACVEVSWRKSTHSGGGTGKCVQVAFVADAVAVRDSKNTEGPTIAITPTAWRTFLAASRT